MVGKFLPLLCGNTPSTAAAAMNEACPNEETTLESEWEEGLEEAQDMDNPDVEKYTYKLVLPEDGYEWKKYGQKFIKNIGKLRSYFKCQKSNCMAKKRVEWLASEEPRKANIKVVYNGSHNHLLPSDEHTSQGSSSSSSASANQYNLLTQYLNLRKS